MPDPQPARLGLSRRQRLKQRREFAAVRAQGQRVAHGCLIANWLKLPAGGRTRLGVVTSKALGGAVIRSRARRLLREAFRLHQHELQSPLALVLVARNSIVGRRLAEVERDLLGALRRARLLGESPRATG
jgi:ribonuclease P protein component